MADLKFDPHLLAGVIGGRRYERENKSENYVEIPPAFIITDSDGAAWTLGNRFVQVGQEFEFNVIRNDVDTGEFAKRIVYKRGVVWLYSRGGWKHFSRNRRHFI